jgi:hypothetical protein
MKLTLKRSAVTLLALITTLSALPSANAIVNPDRSVKFNEAKWTAMITIDFEGGQPEQYCTGVLISRQVVLTVAHCIIDTPMEIISIQVGNTTSKPGDGVTRKPAAVIYHGKFERQMSYDVYDENEILVESVEGEVRPGESPFDSDIALIYLDQPITNIRPIRMPTSERYRPSPGWRTYGWGYTGDNEDIKPDLLLTTAQDDHTRETALEWEDPFEKILAAVRVNGDKSSGTCYGDSGGPLVDSRDVLIGLTSFSDSEICSAPVPTLFTKVSSFLDWQKRAMKLAKNTIAKLQYKDGLLTDEIPVISME